MWTALRYFLFKKRRQKYIDGMYEVQDPWSAQHTKPRLAQYLQQLTNRKFKKALDIGCGEALLSRDLLLLSEQYVGIDVSEAALRRAREQCVDPARAQFYQIDFDRTDSLVGRFDLLVFNFVLDYLGFQKYPRIFAQNLFYILKEKAESDAVIVIFNPIYSDEDFEKLNRYIFVFNQFNAFVIDKQIIQENTFKIACLTLKIKSDGKAAG